MLAIRRDLLLTPARALRGVILPAALLSMSTGCGVLSAIANPKVAWAVQDPAPMSIVVRRADAARRTTDEVERLLTSTPTSASSPWLSKVGPDPKVAAAEVKALTQDPSYKTSHARVLPSEVWVQTLPAVQSSDGDQPNLLSAIDPSLGTQYATIVTKRQERDALSTQLDAENAAADAKGASADDKRAHEAAAAKLEKARSDEEAQIAPLEQAFVGSVKAAAAHVAADQQAKYLPALANLLQALDDADIANSAAAVRYPLAMQSLPTSLKEVALVAVADVLEERTGHRPLLANLKPDVTLHGSEVSLTLGGIDPGDLGDLRMDDLTLEVTKRTSAWAVHALTLLATIDATKKRLAFERDVVSGIVGSWDSTGSAKTQVSLIPAADSPAVAAAVAAQHPMTPRVRPGAPEPAAQAGAKGKPKKTKPSAPAAPAKKPASQRKPEKGSPAHTAVPAT